MPIYMEISPLHRLVTIVARGTIGADEIRGAVQKLADANVRRFGKIVEIAGATAEVTPQQIAGLAQMLRRDPAARGPVAFVVRSKNPQFASLFAAETAQEGPIQIFLSIHEARRWVAATQQAAAQAGQKPAAPVQPAPQDIDIWADPRREGTLFRGSRQRDVLLQEKVTSE
ncbi:hypothetical protein [Reyranella sp.]|uniref:hypothetical protein n=1 Tax=Reyranella sp. TaxID=1929291 RepID=UPI003BAD5287